ncbi:MAG: transcription elongation factor GreA [Tissierellia bacterium]|nr:transcription elongation factor GreA [Tissierellia bacterium]
MIEKDVFFTPEGLAKLEEELDELKSVKRKEMAERIKVALDFGDISENSEYDQAKNEQAQLEERIAKIEMQLRNAKLIDDEELNTHIVKIGSKVVLKDLQDGDEVEYIIVGSAEANPLEGKISNESPVGAQLLGKKKKETVEISVPDGVVKYKVLEIGR